MTDEGQCQDGQRGKDKYGHCVKRGQSSLMWGHMNTEYKREGTVKNILKVYKAYKKMVMWKKKTGKFREKKLVVVCLFIQLLFLSGRKDH